MRGEIAVVPVDIFEQQDFALAVNYAWMASGELLVDANHHPELVSADTARAFVEKVVTHLGVR